MITSQMVKDLRDKTGAGMMDCKRALDAANGDMEQAIENLRKSGAAKAEKKVGRATNQGKVQVKIDGKNAAVVEILCETDFAANTDRFKELVDSVAASALKADGNGDVTEKVNEMEKAFLTERIATIGENMQIRRAQNWKTNGVFACYHHLGGHVGVLVDVEGETDPEMLKDLCLHIAAFSPRYVASADVPAEVVAKEKEIMVAADPKLAGKPAQMLDKILAGKVNKFFSEVCLMNQPWVKDDKTCLAKLRPNIKVNRFVRWAVGEEL